MQNSNSETRPITPERAGQRIWLRIEYETMRLETEFVEATRNVDLPKFLNLLEDHCLKRFDIFALATVPFAKCGDLLGVHERYVTLLQLGEARVLSFLSAITSRIHFNCESLMRQRVQPRLGTRVKNWEARVGLVLLKEGEGTLLVDASGSSDPESSVGASAVTNQVVVAQLQEQIERNGSPADREAFVRPILDRNGWSILDLANECRVDYHTAAKYIKGLRDPYPSTRLKLAGALGVTVDQLPK